MVDVLIGGEMIRLQSGQHDEQYIRFGIVCPWFSESISSLYLLSIFYIFSIHFLFLSVCLSSVFDHV